MRLYTYLVSRLINLLVWWCVRRGRWVDYVHGVGPERLHTDGTRRSVGGHVYLRRYVLFGFMTGDPEPRTDLGRWRRRSLPNLYVHHMHAPDADSCLHDHPWGWAVSWVALGGYREERARATMSEPRSWYVPDDGPSRTVRTLLAPTLNSLSGRTFHRISSLCSPLGLLARNRLWYSKRPWAPDVGTWTIFLAGPRLPGKQWGYLVPGRGWVHQKERHVEMGAVERRAPIGSERP